MDKLAFLVSSVDKFSVCWIPFCHGLEKYWPDHPKALFFITNHKEPPSGQAISVGNDRGWSDNLLFALEKIEAPYILYAQEDYWITSPVYTQNIQEYLTLIDHNHADYIRLYPAPVPDIGFPLDHRLGALSLNAEYRTSLQMALWRKSVLQDLLVSGESPWAFEVNGSRRSRKYGDRFLSVRNSSCGIQYIFTAVIDGEWSKEAYKYAKNEAIKIDFFQLPKRPFLLRNKARVKNFLFSRYKWIQKKQAALFQWLRGYLK